MDPRTGRPSVVDAYKTLQVDPEADPEVIQAAYRRLAQKFHPDRAPGPDAEARMVAINAAWELLRDPERRAAYDRARARGQTATTSTAHAGPPAGSGTSTWPDGAAAESPRTRAGRGAAAADPPRGAGRPTGATGDRPDRTTSPDWTTGRSTTGHGYDPATMGRAQGEGAAGPPPGHPSGSVIGFGRYAGWSLGEIARVDLGYLEWLDRAPVGRAYRPEIDVILRRAGLRATARPDERRRGGLFRRG